MLASREEAPIIHYIWIGPPSKLGVGVPGHDLAGPIKMANANKINPIIFWCLEEHLEFYRGVFNKHDNVQVYSVQDYLAMTQTSAEGTDQINEMIAVCLDVGRQRATARDKVTIKVAWSLFLLQNIGGYVLDTNILPMREYDISLPNLEAFYIPLIVTEESPKKEELDFWMMFSPTSNSSEAKEMLIGYYNNWKKSEKLRDENGPSEEYYAYMSQIMPLHEQFQKKKIKTWIARFNNQFAVIDALGLLKIYSNTHKFEMRAKYDSKLFGEKVKDKKSSEICSAVISGNAIWLRELISFGANVHERIKKATPFYYAGETLLHIAIRFNQLEIIKILLQAGVNPDLTATYPGNIRLSSRALLRNQLKNIEMQRLADTLPKPQMLEDREKEEEKKIGSDDKSLLREHIQTTFVIPFLEAISKNFEAALPILKRVPSHQLSKFLKLANLTLKDGTALAKYAEKNNDYNLTLALVQANVMFFVYKKDDYSNELLRAITVLKENDLFKDENLRAAIVHHPGRARALATIGILLRENKMATEKDISKAIFNNMPFSEELIQIVLKNNILNLPEQHPLRCFLFSEPSLVIPHLEIFNIFAKANLVDLFLETDIYRAIISNPENTEGLSKAIVVLYQDGLFTNEVRHALLLHPDMAVKLVSLCNKLKEEKKLDILPKLLDGPNIEQRVNIGLKLIDRKLKNEKLTDRIDELVYYQLLDPPNADRLLNALSFMQIKDTPFVMMWQDKVDLDQLIDECKHSRTLPF